MTAKFYLKIPICLAKTIAFVPQVYLKNNAWNKFGSLDYSGMQNTQFWKVVKEN